MMMMRRQHPWNQQDYCSKVFYELANLVLNTVKSAAQPTGFSDGDFGRRQVASFFTPAVFASMLMGISLALMLGGLVTFLLGLLLMPWVLGFVVLLCFMGIISRLSMIWKAITSRSSSPPAPRKNTYCFLEVL